MTSPKFLASGRCSPLKDLVEVFVHFKATKSEEKEIWTLGEIRLWKTYGTNTFGQSMNGVDHTAARGRMSPT